MRAFLLCGLTLSCIVQAGGDASVERCLEHFRTAGNMTEQAAALRCLADSETTARAVALSEFETQHTADSLVMDTWFSIQASSSLPSTLDEVKRLEAHPQFSLQNPNKARALIAAFARNAALFHAKVMARNAFCQLVLAPPVYHLSPPLSLSFPSPSISLDRTLLHGFSADVHHFDGPQ